MRVLIIEDESRLARNVAKVLAEETSCAVDTSADGEDGLHMAKSNAYDLLILDLLLPGMDGLEILKSLRAAGSRTPVLILTARDTPADIRRGLDLGGDDYLTKPFDMDELVARCKALIRRAYDRPNPVLAVGDLRINTATRLVSFQGKIAMLGAMEYRMLEYLAMRAGEVVSKADIQEHLYDFGSETVSNVIEVYISLLRKRFDPGPKHRLIHTVRGQGYVLGELPA
ncbi:MAG: response regulator transcription factor [Planctomycetota bacterium]|nr:response regulator transcription factor [Planctomycetota bacterium]